MAAHFRDITPEQRKIGIAWPDCFFDGLDMHIYTLVGVAFVAMLVRRDSFRAEREKRDANRDGTIFVAPSPQEETAARCFSTRLLFLPAIAFTLLLPCESK